MAVYFRDQDGLTFISSFRMCLVISVIITKLNSRPETKRYSFSSKCFASSVAEMLALAASSPLPPRLMKECAEAPMKVYMRYNGREKTFAIVNAEMCIDVVPHM